MGLDMYLLKKKRGEKELDWNNELAYWRKANQIHKWFVDNIQEGTDDCGYYKVERKDVERLLAICEEVLGKSVLKEGKIVDGWTFKNGVRKAILEDGKYIENKEIAEKLLPTSKGFFFGSPEYDEYYIKDLEHTVERCKDILDTFNFEEEELYYTSSW